MSTETRRSFMKKTGAISALTASSVINLNPNAMGANDKVVLGIIGAQSRGSQVAREMIQTGGTFKTICDIDSNIREKFKAEFSEKQNSTVSECVDFRDVLDDRDIDAVLIATPDHWHAIPTIQACQAGKDIYVEKPLSQTIEEGQLMRNAARHYKRVVQVGLQRRSINHFQSAIEFVASGKLGDVCMVKAWMCQVRDTIGNPADEAVPEGVDYDRWLGPAPKRPFNKNRFHYNWRFFWDYGNTELGNQGIHMLDIALWGIHALSGANDPKLPRRISSQAGIYWPLNDAKEIPDSQIVTYDFGNRMLVWELRSFAKHQPIEGTAAGTAFYGTEGCLIVDGRGWNAIGKDGKVMASEESSGGSHTQNFIDSIKNRNKPNSDIELGRLSTTLCHLGNISHHLGHDLHFDTAKESFINQPDADRRLSKQYREPYVLPRV